MNIDFSQWYPYLDESLWERLADGTRWQGFRNNGLDARRHWDAKGRELVSYRMVLQHFLHLYRLCFAIEHHISEAGMSSPRILEVGAWPMDHWLVPPQFSTTLVAILSQNPDYIVAGVDSIDTDTIFPYKSWTLPHYGAAQMFYGDIHDEATRKDISDYLGGKPQLIVGNMVFEKRLGAWQVEQQLKRMSRRTGMAFQINESTMEYEHVAEELANVCRDYLAPGGVLVICNRGYGEIPDCLDDMELDKVYLDERGSPLVEIRLR